VDIFAKLADGWIEPVPATEKNNGLLLLFSSIPNTEEGGPEQSY